MAMKSGSLDYWRSYFRTASGDIFDIIDHAIMVAAVDCPKEFRLRRDRIAEKLFSCRTRRCVGCDQVELAVSCDQEEGADIGCKSGDDRNGCELEEAGGSKESKANSSRDDHVEMNTNQVISYEEVEALTDEIEEEHQIVGEVLRIKEIVYNSRDESDSDLFDSLRRLQLLALSIDTLKTTEIGKAVNRLRKHESKEIRHLARNLIDEWKEMVDQWVNSTNPIAGGTPDSVNPSVVDEEEGLPSPPMDEGVFFATQPIELSQFFDGMDDDGNPRASGGINQNRENGRKSSLESQKISKRKQLGPGDSGILTKNVDQETTKQEANVRERKQSHPNSVPGRPPKVNTEQKIYNETRLQPKSDKISVQRKQVPSQQRDLLKCSDEDSIQVKLEAAKRKLHESYQQADNAKRQRTIQVMELHDIPKQGLGHRNPHMRPGNHNRHWANGRR